MTKEMQVRQDTNIAERVMVMGDLSQLSAEERVEYYGAVCRSLGLNPLTRPFDYIQLNGKLTLYAKKDAADQLRSLNGVSIDDVQITETNDTYIVTVKGHDRNGRTDVEIGVVRKNDMRGDVANAQMKAMTKAKRRFTLSICGLGFLDETEVESIPSNVAVPVIVTETGEVLDGEAIDEKAVSAWNTLVDRANASSVPVPEVDFDAVKKSELREIYKELEGFVKDAEDQAGA